jgi:hypothetical protein
MAETNAQCGFATVLPLGWNRPRRVEGPVPETGFGFFDSSEGQPAKASHPNAVLAALLFVTLPENLF